jgi:hypothetical protein
MEILNAIRMMLMAGSQVKPAYALSCGDYLAANTTVVLTQDLYCPGKQYEGALVAAGDNVTINLNGHNLICTGAYCGTDSFSTGIYNYVPVKKFKIIGPGKVAGFGTDITIFASGQTAGGTTGLLISQVTVAGPSSYGISVGDAGTLPCNKQNNPFVIPPPAFEISNNQVSAVAVPLQITNSYCGLIRNNLIADNNGSGRGIINFGITSKGDYNLLIQNTVVHNGWGSVGGGGISVEGSHNQVNMNYLTMNNAYGITVKGSNSGANLFYGNTIRYTTNGPDLSDFNTGPLGNSWNPNNTCSTQQNLPAGVCNPGE